MCICFNSGKSFLFADDLKVVYTFQPNQHNIITSTIQKDLDMLRKWCDTWLLTINTQKSGYMLFGVDQVRTALILNNQPLLQLNNICDLGVRYSSDLSFSEQTAAITSKARQLIGFINRNFHLHKTKIALYKMSVRPILEYCPIILSGLRYSGRQSIEKIQRYLTRLIDPITPYRERCYKYGLEPLWLRRIRLNLIVFFKVLHKEILTSVSAIKFARDKPRSLRNQSCLVDIPKALKQRKSTFFVSLYSQIWNRLPQNVRCCKTLLQFKSALNHYIKHEGLCKILNRAHIDDVVFYDSPSNI